MTTALITFRQKSVLKIQSLCRITYLNSVESHIVCVVDHTQQTVRETNKSSSQQKDEVILIQTHLRRTVTVKTHTEQSDCRWSMWRHVNKVGLRGSCLPDFTLWARVAKCLISAPDGDGATPSHDYSHDTVGQGADKLTWVEQLTQQGNFRTCNSWDDSRETEQYKNYNQRLKICC